MADMNDYNVQLNVTDNLPISFALGTHLGNQVDYIRTNPLDDHMQALGRNQDVLFNTLYVAVNAIRALEQDIEDLKAQLRK